MLLLGLLTALLVVGTTYFWIKASDKKASELGEAPWLDGLSTEVPEGKKETFEKAGFPLKSVHLWSDGCAGQFKTKTQFYFLTLGPNYGVKMDHHLKTKI